MADWIERVADESVVSGLVASGMSRLMARLLALRGIGADDAQAYFSPNFRELAPPEDLPGVAEATGIILAALKAKERIVVFGDYDCDGVCAAAIMVLALRSISAALNPGSCPDAQITPFIPERLTEGYGLSDDSVSRLLKETPDVRLVVTVDNGVNAVEQIALLNERGIKVVVTDHHLPGEEMPAAAALVDPKVAAPSYLEDLCGAAVAYFLAKALVSRARAETGNDSVAKGIGGNLFTLAGLATVTDIMPLTAQNRIFVAESLCHFPKWAPVGLKELHSRAARTGVEAMTARDFGFILGPRINAVGRLGSGGSALELLLCPESARERSRSLAMDIDLCNMRRRQIEQRMTDAALAQVRTDVPSQVIALSSDSPDVHPGVAGIVASRILERLGPNAVPVCVLVDGKGSARAPAGYNIRDALAEASASLFSFGGHAAAAGLGVKEGALETFKTDFSIACERQRANIPKDIRGVKFVDAILVPREITIDLAESVSRMEPFGEGNPEPLFALCGVHFSSGGIRTLGSAGNHLQFTFTNHFIPRAVWWGHGDQIERFRAESTIPHDIMFTLGLSEYGGHHAEIHIVDIKPSSR